MYKDTLKSASINTGHYLTANNQNIENILRYDNMKKMNKQIINESRVNTFKY